VVEVTLEGVSKAYGTTDALVDVSLEIRDGEFFTLVGPSGCGKTTTLRLLAGFEEPTAGTIRFGGDDVAGVPPEDRDVGIVFQNYALFPTMTVAENVAYGLRFREPPGGGSTEDRVSELLDLVDLTGMGDRDPDALSGGQRQRVALARALAPGPSVLLLDEPMSALDARLRERLRVQVTEIQETLDITTVYVTHDQAEALAISDRVAVVNDGRIEQVADPETVYRQPATRFVAGFVGDNNLLDGEIVGRDPLTVAVDGQRLVLPAGVDAAVGDRVTVCLRPEALSVGGGPSRFEVEVEHVEFLGDAYRLHCTWQGRSLLVKSGSPASGTVTVGVEPGAIHVLDAAGD